MGCMQTCRILTSSDFDGYMLF